MHGQWKPVQPGEVFRCPCGKVKDGDMVGPRGGKVWKYMLASGEELCGPKCEGRDQVEAVRANDEMRGEWEADQAAARYSD